MKKLLSLLLSLALIFTLAACGNTPDAPVAPTDDIADTSATEIAGESTGGGDSTSSDTSAAETVTDASGRPVTDTAGKPVTTIVTTRPTAGSGSASVTAPTYQRTTAKTTGKTTAKTTVKTVTQEQKTVDRLFTLSTGQSESGITLTGTVTYVKEAYTDRYGNATFEIEVAGVTAQRIMLCYRVTPADPAQSHVQVGQTVTLSGTVQNYKGTIEFYPATYQLKGGAVVTTTTTRPVGNGSIDPDGVYDSKDEVALYIHTYGRLPKNYITKSQYQAQGKPRDKTCGGDRFYNNEGLLPSGYTYYECDIDTLGTTNRGTKRIVWTTSGIVYYTSDHYASFTKLYGAR